MLRAIFFQQRKYPQYYKVSEKVALDFSVTSRIGGNDKWDAKISSKDDMFIFYSLGTTIKLSK